ncbi:MAG: pyridoxal-phosphate dependent enzyme [Nitrososphaerota archaeon]|nr:pyridoxal-phosphate dependent enzyme [Nitrososphaerota archaeon]
MSLEEAELRGWRTECKTCKANMHVVYEYENQSLRAQVKSALESVAGEPYSSSSYSPIFFQIPSLLPIHKETLEQVRGVLQRTNSHLPGSTQLRKSNRYPGLYLKCENENPTGSFKDVGTICEFSKSYELSLIRNSNSSIMQNDQPKEAPFTLHLASTGNMGISATYYASALTIPLILHITNHIHPEKIQKMEEFGLFKGKVSRCDECATKDGGYDFPQSHVRELFEKAKTGSTMWVGDTTLRIEGCKTIGYEIFAQLDFKIPDSVIVPVGNGTLLCAIWKAFDELRRMEFSTKMPRIYGIVVPERLYSKVSAIGVSRPVDLTTVFKIVRDTNGGLLSLEEESIEEGTIRLGFSEQGIRAERAGAVSYAAYERILASSKKEDQTCVALITGSEPMYRRTIQSEKPNLNLKTINESLVSNS